MDPTLSKFIGKVAVVTGASSGIGEAIVDSLVCKGLLVVGLARRKERLEEIAKRLKNQNGKFFPMVTDVSKEEDIVKSFNWIKINVGPISILVNNAGCMRAQSLIDGNPKAWKEVFDINVLGLCTATKLAISDMISNNINGHVIHINSVVGHMIPTIPDINVYPASKWAVTALTGVMRHELVARGSKIKVTSISPGAVKTEFALAGGIKLGNTDVDLFDTIPSLKSEDIADSVVYVLSTPPHVQIHELTIKPIGETL